jgi:hypothetical protein
MSTGQEASTNPNKYYITEASHKGFVQQQMTMAEQGCQASHI